MTVSIMVSSCSPGNPRLSTTRADFYVPDVEEGCMQ